MFKKLLALLLIPSLAFGQAASSVIAEKPIIQGATGVQVVVTGTGEIRLVTSADTTAKGFYLDSSTGNLTSVGSAGIGSATSALGTIFANIVQAATGSNLDLKARNGSVRMFAIGSDSTPVETWRFSSNGSLTQDGTNGGNILFNKDGSFLGIGTTDGTDNKYTCIASGTACSRTRGGFIALNGNEVASVGGNIDINTGDGANDTLNIYQGANLIWSFGGSTTGALTQDGTNGGDLIFNLASGVIRQGTSDAADTNRTWLVGGGSGADTRGAYIIANGNEQGSTPGELRLVGGNISGGNTTFYNGGSLRWTLDTSGNFTQDGTNGGNIVLSRNANATIRRSADNDVLTVAGGSSRSTASGAYIDLFGGNSAPGDARIYAANISGGSIDLATGNAVTRISLLDTGSIVLDRTNTAGGTTGAQTINKMAGSVNFAAADTSLVVTNSLVATTSNIFCQVQTNDATFTSVKSCVPGSGSFTINANAAATAETRVAFWVTN